MNIKHLLFPQVFLPQIISSYKHIDEKFTNNETSSNNTFEILYSLLTILLLIFVSYTIFTKSFVKFYTYIFRTYIIGLILLLILKVYTTKGSFSNIIDIIYILLIGVISLFFILNFVVVYNLNADSSISTLKTILFIIMPFLLVFDIYYRVGLRGYTLCKSNGKTIKLI